MLPQNSRTTVAGKRSRPSTATSKPNQFITPPINLTNADITKQLLQIKESDLELAKARFDFQVGLEKQRTYDYQNMLKGNYEEAAKMFQKINNEQLELIKRENENVIQKLMKRHNDEILSLTTKHEYEMRNMAEDKKKTCDTYEERIRVIRKDFSETLDKERQMFEQQMEKQREDLKEKHEKKLEASKEKMKAKFEALKQKNDKKMDEKLDVMFEKMNSEFEKRQSDLYNTLVEKDGMIKSLERKLGLYQLEIDKWKDLYYASQRSAPSIENYEINNQKSPEQRRAKSNYDSEKKKVGSSEKKEHKKSIEKLDDVKRDFSDFEALQSAEKPKEQNESIEENRNEEDYQEKELEQKNEEEILYREGMESDNVDLRSEGNKENINEQVVRKEQGSRTALDSIDNKNEPFKEKATPQSINEEIKRQVKLCNVETMTEVAWPDREMAENRANNDAELEAFIVRAEEKAQSIVERDIEVIRYYQNSLVKCMGKIKEYQLLIQKFNEGTSS